MNDLLNMLAMKVGSTVLHLDATVSLALTRLAQQADRQPAELCLRVWPDGHFEVELTHCDPVGIVWTKLGAGPSLFTAAGACVKSDWEPDEEEGEEDGDA